MSNLVQDIKWDVSYEIGDETVDAQHRRLFEILGELIESCEAGREPQRVQDTLSFLVNYAVKHFNDEEALQQKYGYPHYNEHKQIHENFKNTVGGLVQRFCESQSVEKLRNDVEKILVKWILNHIQRDDRKIGEYIKSSAAKGL